MKDKKILDICLILSIVLYILSLVDITSPYAILCTALGLIIAIIGLFISILR